MVAFRQKWFWLAGLLGLLMVSGCASKTADRAHYQPSVPVGQKVVILYDPTPFKQELVVLTSQRGSIFGLEVYTDLRTLDTVTGASRTESMSALANQIVRTLQHKLRKQTRSPYPVRFIHSV